jgi:uncharacterized lipoprotein YmbA
MSRRAGLITVAVVLGACALVRRPPEMRYYTLAVPGAPAARLPAPLVVGAFTADEPYATARLAYRTSPYRLDYYVYHRWAADPRRVVAAAVRDYLERAAPAADGPPLALAGHVRRLEEVDAAEGCRAALALDVSVEREGSVRLARSYADTEPAEACRPEAVAAALSVALGRIVDRVVADLGTAAAPAREVLLRGDGHPEADHRQRRAFALQAVYGDALLASFALWPVGRYPVPELDGAVGFRPWQLVTSAFLHANLAHLALNMLALYIFGRDVERALEHGATSSSTVRPSCPRAACSWASPRWCRRPDRTRPSARRAHLRRPARLCGPLPRRIVTPSFHRSRCRRGSS